MLKEHKIQFFTEEVIVEKVCANTGQAVIFFGRDSVMKINLVLKQYKLENFKGLFRELKMFTYLENEKNMD